MAGPGEVYTLGQKESAGLTSNMGVTKQQPVRGSVPRVAMTRVMLLLTPQSTIVQYFRKIREVANKKLQSERDL